MCICAAGVCRGYLCPHAHFSGAFVYTPAWVSTLFVLFEMAVVGQSHGTAAGDTPFFVCGSNRLLTILTLGYRSVRKHANHG